MKTGAVSRTTDSGATEWGVQ